MVFLRVFSGPRRLAEPDGILPLGSTRYVPSVCRPPHLRVHRFARRSVSPRPASPKKGKSGMFRLSAALHTCVFTGSPEGRFPRDLQARRKISPSRHASFFLLLIHAPCRRGFACLPTGARVRPCIPGPWQNESGVRRMLSAAEDAGSAAFSRARHPLEAVFANVHGFRHCPGPTAMFVRQMHSQNAERNGTRQPSWVLRRQQHGRLLVATREGRQPRLERPVQALCAVRGT